jgi:adenylosuccinate synthase
VLEVDHFLQKILKKLVILWQKLETNLASVTGRKRRCGWLDLVALKYAVQINGVTQLMMMKGDVLSGFETLKVCTGYNYKGKNQLIYHTILKKKM